jgi:hypothetical protein
MIYSIYISLYTTNTIEKNILYQLGTSWMAERNDCCPRHPGSIPLKNDMNKYIVVMASSLLSLYVLRKPKPDIESKLLHGSTTFVQATEKLQTLEARAAEEAPTC